MEFYYEECYNSQACKLCKRLFDSVKLRHICHVCEEDLFYEEMNNSYDELHNPDIDVPAEYNIRKNVLYPRKSDRLNRKVKKRPHFTEKWRENSIVQTEQYSFGYGSDSLLGITIVKKSIVNIIAENYLKKITNRENRRTKAPRERKLRKGRGKNKKKTKGVMTEPRKVYV